ncbi:hypothetical protein [uncultured Thalassospira sp.]|uniref:hypothetical protein n=1 Tax=uncultured Thalassospira sp. TaxID=404382 RepID=UPI00258FF29B|nr:hypothetical protein [uncultured Thalassospira sp.]
MRTKFGLLVFGAVMSLSAGTMAFSAKAQTYFPPDVDKSGCALSQDDFNNDWTRLSVFSPGAPFGPVYDATSGMVYVFPANGPSFESTKPDHCDFYKWGAQMFLWLTSTIDDTGSQTTNPTFSSKLPYVFNSEFFYRLSSDHKNLLAQGSGADAPNMQISLRHAKSDEDESIGQAGGNGVLLTQGSSPSLTYYGVHVNRLYGYFLNLYDKVISRVIDINQDIKIDPVKIDPKLSRFPTTSAEACATIFYAKEKGFVEHGDWPDLIEHLLCPYFWPAPGKTPTTIPTIPEIEPAVDFLSLAVELKTSWVDTSTLPANKLHKYVRQNLEIPVYDKSNPDRWFVTGSETRELAMVGMHVVGSVEGHPEMIWATIEHEDNAPNSTYYYMNSNGKVTEVSGPQTGSSWTFSDGTVVDEVAEFAVSCDSDKMPKGCVEKSDIVAAIDVPNTTPLEIPIQPSNVTRLHPWGNVQTSSNSDVISQNTQIISLNNDVRNLIKANNSGDPRQYYFLSGALWTSDGSIPTKEHYPENTGSMILANTTMETFEQQTSCFGCHNTFGSSNGLDISHIFSDISPDLPKAPDK